MSALTLAYLTLDITGNNLAIETNGQFTNEQSAKDAVADIEKAKKEFTGGPVAFLLAAQGVPKQAIDALNNVAVNQSGNQISIKTAIEIPADLIKKAFPTPGVGMNQGPSSGSRKILNNNYKQLGLAFHNYIPTAPNAVFPAVYRPMGKPFSWRVAVLGELEGKAIHDKLHLDEDWDSPHNLEVARTAIPACYKPVGRSAQPGETFVKTIVGPDTIFGMNNVTGFQSMKKGTSNTILFFETENPVIWTKPEEITYSSDLDFKSELYWLSGVTTVTMADGSIKWIKDSTPNEQFHKAVNQKIQERGILD